MPRKSQAAMEFLLTYGWAILVVLVVIGALVYFGVLKPSRLLPDKCTATAGFSCGDFTASTDGITVKIVNKLGSAINIPPEGLKFSSPDSTACEAGNINTIFTLAADASVPITATNCLFEPGGRVRGTFTIKYYTTAPEFTHDVTVDVTANLNPPQGSMFSSCG